MLKLHICGYVRVVWSGAKVSTCLAALHPIPRASMLGHVGGGGCYSMGEGETRESLDPMGTGSAVVSHTASKPSFGDRQLPVFALSA